MKTGANLDNTFNFFQETIDALNHHEGHLTKEQVLNAFLLAANEQSPRTQRAINRYIKQQHQAFISKTTAIKDSKTESELKMILKAVGVAFMCSVAIAGIVTFHPLMMGFVTTYTSSIAGQYLFLLFAATFCLIAKGYFEHSQKKPLEVLYTNVDQTIENVPSNLKYLTNIATTAATLAATKTVSALTETIVKKPNPTAEVNKSKAILTNFKQRKSSSPSSRVLRSSTRHKPSLKN